MSRKIFDCLNNQGKLVQHQLLHTAIMGECPYCEIPQLKKQLERERAKVKVLVEALRYPEKLPSDIYSPADYLGEFCYIAREALKKCEEINSPESGINRAYDRNGIKSE